MTLSSTRQCINLNQDKGSAKKRSPEQNKHIPPTWKTYSWWFQY